MKTSIMVIILSTLLSACGPGTTGGNPLTVTVESSPYTNDGSLVMLQPPLMKFMTDILFIPSAYAAPVSDFKFCITKMKVVSSSGGAPSASQEAILGLVDVSNAGVVNDWGKISLAEGSVISEVHFEIHQDADNCSGADYSLQYNGVKITKDLEFKFKFDPLITVLNGDTLNLNLGVIAKAVEDAHFASKLTNEEIGNYLQTNTIGTGQKL